MSCGGKSGELGSYTWGGMDRWGGGWGGEPVGEEARDHWTGE